VRERISATRNSRLDKESSDETSHSMTWMFCWLLSDESSDVSFDFERTAAMMVVEGWEASWRTNSRPMPRLAPVRKYVGILEYFLPISALLAFEVGTEKWKWWLVVVGFVIAVLPRDTISTG